LWWLATNSSSQRTACRAVSSADGSVDRAALPEPAFDAECSQRYTAHTGVRLDRDSTEYNQSLWGCTLMRHFELAATAAAASH
jgi:hypothetical protein